jgi:hypothetical protein
MFPHRCSTRKLVEQPQTDAGQRAQMVSFVQWGERIELFFSAPIVEAVLTDTDRIRKLQSVFSHWVRLDQ